MDRLRERRWCGVVRRLPRTPPTPRTFDNRMVFKQYFVLAKQTCVTVVSGYCMIRRLSCRSPKRSSGHLVTFVNQVVLHSSVLIWCYVLLIANYVVMC
jgi:hypothetical protein